VRVLVVHAHPVPGSFNSALNCLVTTTLEAAGHEVRSLDLYAEGFDPVMSTGPSGTRTTGWTARRPRGEPPS
jgi:putative NADPH-quinone reductase